MNPGSDTFPAKPARPAQHVAAAVLAIGMQVAVFAALLWPQPAPPPPREQAALVLVKIADEPKIEPPGPAMRDADPSADFARPDAPQASAPSVVLARITRPDNSDLLSASQIAGAASAEDDGGGGGGGGDCNTARRVQQALQRDPLVRTAVEDAHRVGQAVMLWNGDWVRSGAQDGKGLSAVREAITWELAFAPESCRNRRMHGLVLLSLADGNTRFAIGAGDWRWSDLLGVR